MLTYVCIFERGFIRIYFCITKEQNRSHDRIYARLRIELVITDCNFFSFFSSKDSSGLKLGTRSLRILFKG